MSDHSAWPWFYGYKSGEERPDTEWGSIGLYDRHGIAIIANEGGWDNGFEGIPNEADISLIVGAPILLSILRDLCRSLRHGSARYPIYIARKIDQAELLIRLIDANADPNLMLPRWRDLTSV